MRLDITGRHLVVSDALRELVGKRLAKMERVLNDAALSAQVILAKEKYRHQAEVLVHTRGDHVLRGAGEGNSWPLAIRKATDRIEQQAATLKGKWIGRKRKSAGSRVVEVAEVEVVAPASVAKVIRAKRYAVKPMSIEDAALRVDVAKETFVVFRNVETEAISILYRRKDGHLGLIVPD